MAKIGPFTIIDPKDPGSLPKKSDRYAVVYKMGDRIERFVEDYNAEEKRWLTGWSKQRVQILAWAELPEIPKQLLKEVS